MMKVYDVLKEALGREIRANGLSGRNISVRCKALSAAEAIGNPDHDDYPIIKGREVMVEAVFEGARGQAFADDYENADYLVDDLLDIDLGSNRRRAAFISGLNAVYRHLGLCGKTIHCRDAEPKDCAENLPEAIGDRKRICLVGFQPRFLETLAARYDVRAVDMDPDNIGAEKFGVVVESPRMTDDAVDWCDLVFATGSTVVNGTIDRFLDREKPVLFYGVTISAAARILGLRSYCRCGH